MIIIDSPWASVGFLNVSSGIKMMQTSGATLSKKKNVLAVWWK